MTVTVFANNVKIPEDELSKLQIWNPSLQKVFDDVVNRVKKINDEPTAHN